MRDGARQILAAALQAEVAAHVEQFKDELDEHDRRLWSVMASMPSGR